MMVEAIRLQNGPDPSVLVPKARCAVVGQVVNLRPIVNRPGAACAKAARRVNNPPQVDNLPHVRPA